MRPITTEEWQRAVWAWVVRPWRDALPLREQRQRHLVFSDWLEEIGNHVLAQIIREGYWYLYFNWVFKRYTFSVNSPKDWGGPLAMHWWPRRFLHPIHQSVDDLADALLDSELWTRPTS
jgi:hypothetical protein